MCMVGNQHMKLQRERLSEENLRGTPSRRLCNSQSTTENQNLNNYSTSEPAPQASNESCHGNGDSIDSNANELAMCKTKKNILNIFHFI